MDFRYRYFTEDSQEQFRKLLIAAPELFRNPLLATPDNFQAFSRLLDVTNETSFIILDKDCPVGLFLSSVRNEHAYLISLAISEDHRGMGYGRIVLQKGLSLLSETGCRELLLDVVVSNKPAIGLYSNEGFSTRSTLSFFRNEQRTFHTGLPDSGISVVLADSEAQLQPLLRYFQPELRSWNQNFRSILLQIKFGNARLYTVQSSNKTIGYAVIIPRENGLHILDIGIPNLTTELFKTVITSLARDHHVVQTYGFYDDDPIYAILLESGFFVDKQQYEMIRKLS